MARPIPMELPKRDPREQVRSRLEQAPAEHAEAVFAGLEVLQGLHEALGRNFSMNKGYRSSYQRTE